MNYSKIEAYALTRKAAVLEFPFDWETPVVKVGGKLFFLGMPSDPIPRINLKCDPERAQLYRSMFPAVTPGWHMNKEHWNTLQLDGSVPDELVMQMVDDSYRLVVQTLPRRVRQGLELLPD